ncbi:hypothetical protein NIES3974_25610 [Calothrix sp. NIES-3974]|nr:hypothetical protein NIES3974_25610 [Calothrix sp. NIES-3974]
MMTLPSKNILANTDGGCSNILCKDADGFPEADNFDVSPQNMVWGFVPILFPPTEVIGIADAMFCDVDLMIRFMS